MKLDFSKLRIMVVGECCVDQYREGKSTRFSEEDSTVPVVTGLRTTGQLLGMAANVVMNLRALGAQTRLFSVFGQDKAGSFLDEKLGDPYRLSSMKTAVKTRLLVNGKHLARLDSEKQLNLSEKLSDLIFYVLCSQLQNYDAVILQDYGKGLWNQSTLQFIRVAKEQDKKVFVDPYRGQTPEAYRGAYLIKPNLAEARAMLGLVSPERATRSLWARSQAEVVVTTLGSLGMLYSVSEGNVQVPTIPVDAVDVAGAGDTALSVITLAMMSGIPIQEALVLANRAARKVVQQLGVSTVTVKDLGE